MIQLVSLKMEARDKIQGCQIISHCIDELSIADEKSITDSHLCHWMRDNMQNQQNQKLGPV